MVWKKQRLLELAFSCWRIEHPPHESRGNSKARFSDFRLAVLNILNKGEQVTVDWSELNSELLHLISKKLENFSNLIRFRSVCKQWRLAVDPADLPALLPYLLQPDPTLSSTDYRIFSVLSNTTSQIKLPIAISHEDFKNHACQGTYMGFLLVNSFTPSKAPFLFNPLTETKLHIPFSKCINTMVYMGPNPNSKSRTMEEGVHLVAHVLDSCERDIIESIMFWRSNNDKTTTFRIPPNAGPASPVYYKGKLFVNHWQRKETSIFDMETGDEMNIVIPNPKEVPGLHVLVEAMGDLLALAMVCSYFWTGPYKFKVYRLEHTDDFEQYRWIEFNGIGDRVLFLNTQDQVFCLSTSDLEGFRGNCIYYLQLFENINKDGQCSHCNSVLRYNMGDGTTEEVLNNVDVNSTWFVPSLS
ncbi:hypothetical protein LUZ61_002898 [Rhynchospora tenuis]|uniref:F-box domain-containing protein n=1 Tax=Rhynchospora tenuis TaxID=198213 RepID=A0AAD6ES44_9POAL|nr:hypothetical protein LUZ61_002898 [Rhynchospora tenuis]